MKEEVEFTVECNVCRQQYDNWVGSTPCCGSIAFIVGNDGQTTKKVGLYSSAGITILDFAEKDKIK